MADPAARVVLLARAGEASAHLQAAIRDAGGDLVLVADPISTQAADVTDARPDAVLVALEPSIEDSLERFGSVLGDPDITVIFDEVELASKRTGWDAARWSRHLAAKLHRHDDVLPPGADVDGDWHPDPGNLPVVGDSAFDITAFAKEAETRAPGVPRDDNIEFSPDLTASLALDGSGSDLDDDAATFEVSTDSIPPFRADAEADADQLARTGHSSSDEDATGVSYTGLQLVDSDDLMASLDSSAPRAAGVEIDEDDFDFAVSLRSANANAAANDNPDDDVIDLDRLLAGDAKSAGVSTETAGDAELQAALDALSTPSDDNTADADAPVDLATTRAPMLPTPSGSFGAALSLVNDDAPFSVGPDAQGVARATDNSRFAVNLESLEQRASAMSLADTDSYGQGPVQGLAWIEGGLGAPDAVRQLLGALPTAFARPVVVRLQLDGGRYDRLVKQMARASSLPVALAEAGQSVEVGNVYFIPLDVSIERRGSGFCFVADASRNADPFVALSDTDSALLWLSGSDAALITAAAAQFAARGWMAAQSPDTCYDPMAATALIAQGGGAGSPIELAAQLAQRWPQ